MDGHVIHALLRLLFDHFEHHAGGEIFDALDARDRFVNRHGADRDGRMADDGFANRVNVAAGREVHHRVGAVVDGGVQLLELFFDVRGDGRVADVGVDLAQRRHADRHRLQFGMVDVRGDDHAAASDFIAHQFGRDLLAVGDVLHLVGDHALARVVHLREVAVCVFGLPLRQPLCPRFENRIQTTAVCRLYHCLRTFSSVPSLRSVTCEIIPCIRDAVYFLGEVRLVSCAAGESESLRRGREPK